MASATFSIIDEPVGPGARNHKLDVLRVQQLLQLNGFMIGTTGHWHKETTDALVSFQRTLTTPLEAYYELDPGLPHKRIINPDDKLLFELAYRAKVLIRLAPGGRTQSHALAFEDVHRWCQQERIPFDMRHRCVWGLEGYLNWAVVTEHDDEFDGAAFDTEKPRALNCTLYINLMMSVWKQGNAHKRPFNPDVSSAGRAGYGHFAEHRYGYKLVGKYESADDISGMTNRHSLYCIEFGADTANHIGLLYNGSIYECNNRPTPDVHSIPVAQWVLGHPWGWVLGPAPM